MLSEALKRLIYQNLPTEVTVKGVPFTIVTRYANQYEHEKFPAVTLQYHTTSNPKTLNIDRVRRKEYITTDSILYDDSTEGSFDVSKAAASKSAGLSEVNPDCNMCHDAVTCGNLQPVGDSTQLFVGWDAALIPAMFLLHRLGLIFDTNGIPTLTKRSDIILLSAYLRTYIYSVGPDISSEKLVIQSGLPDYPSTPVIATDYDYSKYSGNYGELALFGLSGFQNISINDLSFIQRGDYTKMMLRTSDDIANTCPGMMEVKTVELGVTSIGVEKTTLELEFAYRLSVNYAYEVVEVKGTVSGSEYTFDPSEYQLVEEGPTGFYKSIQFLGPTYPDDETYFTVTYKHAWVREWQGGEFTDSLSVNVWAKDYKDKTPTGDEIFINGILIAQSIAEYINQWFRYNCDDLSDSFTVDSVTEIRDLDGTIEGEMERRRQFDVVIAHVESVEKTKVATVEEVDTPTITIE